MFVHGDRMRGAVIAGHQQRRDMPGLQGLLLSQLAEHPSVVRIPHTVHHGQSGSPVVGLVQTAIGLEGKVGRDHDLRAHLAHRACDVPAQVQSVLQHPVRVVQDAQIAHAHMRAGGALLLGTVRCHPLRRLRHPGLAGREQQIGDLHAAGGPGGHGG